MALLEEEKLKKLIKAAVVIEVRLAEYKILETRLENIKKAIKADLIAKKLKAKRVIVGGDKWEFMVQRQDWKKSVPVDKVELLEDVLVAHGINTEDFIKIPPSKYIRKGYLKRIGKAL